MAESETHSRRITKTGRAIPNNGLRFPSAHESVTSHNQQQPRQRSRPTGPTPSAAPPASQAEDKKSPTQTAHDQNTNRNPCVLPRSLCEPTKTCAYVPAPTQCRKPVINVKCQRGWFDDLRRLGIINFIGDILCLLTFTLVLFAIAEYFLCPDLNAENDKQPSPRSHQRKGKFYFFCSEPCSGVRPPEIKITPPHEEEPQIPTKEDFEPRAEPIDQ